MISHQYNFFFSLLFIGFYYFHKTTPYPRRYSLGTRVCRTQPWGRRYFSFRSHSLHCHTAVIRRSPLYRRDEHLLRVILLYTPNHTRPISYCLQWVYKTVSQRFRIDRSRFMLLCSRITVCRSYANTLITFRSTHYLNRLSIDRVLPTSLIIIINRVYSLP